MITVSIDEPCSVYLQLKPGDKIQVSEMTPELTSLLSNTRIDGSKVARVTKASGREVETRQTVPA